MAKFSGVIGFVSNMEETAPGIFNDVITEKHYRGDILRNNTRLNEIDRVNEDVVISNTFSIVADAFAYSNLQKIKYITYLGNRWKVSTVEIRRPRLLITIGKVYNG